MGVIKDLFGKIGENFFGIFTDEKALYALYVIAFFFGIYTIFRILLQKVPQFKGKPANVIAFMITIISVGGIFYGKSNNQLILLFNGFIGFIFMLLLSIGILTLAIFYSNKTKDMPSLRWLIISSGLYITSSLLLSPFREFFNENQGAPKVFFDILTTIQEISLLVMLITLVMFIFSFLKGGISSVSKNQSPEKKNRNEMKGHLKGILDETKKSEDLMKRLNDNLVKLNKIVMGDNN